MRKPDLRDMVRRPRGKVWAALIAAVLLVLAAIPLAHAETIYKFRGAGRVIEYSNTRPKGVPILAEMDSQALAEEQRNTARAAPGAPPVAPSRLQADADARLQRMARADADVQRAERQLRDAEAALAQGREPLPGERSGTVSGYSRLNESYAARITRLERAVELARAQLDEAYRARRSI